MLKWRSVKALCTRLLVRVGSGEALRTDTEEAGDISSEKNTKPVPDVNLSYTTVAY
jgi:hypothetical protein